MAKQKTKASMSNEEGNWISNEYINDNAKNKAETN